MLAETLRVSCRHDRVGSSLLKQGSTAEVCFCGASTPDCHWQAIAAGERQSIARPAERRQPNGVKTIQRRLYWGGSPASSNKWGVDW